MMTTARVRATGPERAREDYDPNSYTIEHTFGGRDLSSSGTLGVRKVGKEEFGVYHLPTGLLAPIFARSEDGTTSADVRWATRFSPSDLRLATVSAARDYMTALDETGILPAVSPIPASAVAAARQWVFENQTAAA